MENDKDAVILSRAIVDEMERYCLENKVTILDLEWFSSKAGVLTRGRVFPTSYLDNLTEENYDSQLSEMIEKANRGDFREITDRTLEYASGAYKVLAECARFVVDEFSMVLMSRGVYNVKFKGRFIPEEGPVENYVTDDYKEALAKRGDFIEPGHVTKRMPKIDKEVN